MIAALAAWPYEQDFIPSNYWDDLGISPAGAFDPTVGRALDDGLLTDTDYDAILNAIAHYGRWISSRSATQRSWDMRKLAGSA